MRAFLGLCVVLVAWGLIAGPASAARILAALPFSVYSHTMPFMPIFKELAEKGNEFHLISNFTIDPPPKTFKHISYDLNIRILIEKMSEELGEFFDPKDFNGALYHTSGLWTACPGISKILLQHVKPVLPPPTNNYDLVIIEPFFCQEFMMGLSHYYNAPLVGIVPTPITPCIAQATGNPLLSSDVPNLRLPLTDNMNYLERVWNTAINLFELIGYNLYHLPRQDTLMRELLPKDSFPSAGDIPYISDLHRNISLLLTETHPALVYPRPVLKNIIEVGGASIKTGSKLPKELEDYVNSAEDGVIYFSWGSHYVEKKPEPILKALMNVFSKVKQKVIFKWSDLNIANKPDNVLVSKWVPQLALLAHPKTQLFISHCGLNSIFETTYFGVPIIGTPLFGDQPYNALLLESIGMGLTVPQDKITDEAFIFSAIDQVLTNFTFRDNAKLRSKMMRDRPMPVVKEAAYWIDYVVKYSGAKHLRPIEMPWFVKAQLDVWLLFVILPILPFIVIMTCLKVLKKSPHNVEQKHSKQKKLN